MVFLKARVISFAGTDRECSPVWTAPRGRSRYRVEEIESWGWTVIHRAVLLLPTGEARERAREQRAAERPESHADGGRS